MATTKTEQRANRVTRRFLILAGIAALVLVVIPIGTHLFERDRNQDLETIPKGYLWLVRSLIEEDSAYALKTPGGYLLSYLLTIAGISLVAFISGAIASKLVTTVMTRGNGMGSTSHSGHVVICGWSAKGAEIIRELRAREVEDHRHIVVLCALETDPTRVDEVEFIRGDPSVEEDLLRAGVDRCSMAIILADESMPSGSDVERDARTLFTVLAVETINADAYSCVEVIRAENSRHFANTHANELVVTAEVTGALLAGSARNPGLSRVVTDLVTHPERQEFYRIAVPPDLVGAPVSQALIELKERQEALLVGLVEGMDQYTLNPPMDLRLSASHKLLVISSYVNVDTVV